MNLPVSSACAESPPSAADPVPIPLLPLITRRIELECLRPTTIGLFPEARLASLLLASMHEHKDSPDSLSIEVPRSARYQVARGDRFGFTLFASLHDRARVDAITALLQGLPGGAPTAGQRSVAFGDNWKLSPSGAVGASLLDEPALDAEAQRWIGVREFRIRLTSPTRIALGQKEARGRARYCREEADVSDDTLSRALVSSLVSLKFSLKLGMWVIPPLPLHIRRKELFLVDPGRRSDRAGAKPLDEGMLGELLVEWREPPSLEQWRHLVLLQYLGLGQGRAFGLGRLQLETREGIATKALLPVDHRSLQMICEESNLVQALDHVRQRRDLTQWPELDELPEAAPEPVPPMLDTIARRLAAGLLEPAPLVPVALAKPDGSTRELLIPSFFDRVAQRAVLQRVEPGLDMLFCESSFGFRRGIGREAARARIERLRDEGYVVVGETDIRRFFDDVGWWRIESRLRCLFGNDPLVDQVLRWIETPRADGVQRLQGLPQGAPLSPILSNLMLDHLDRVLLRRGVHPVRFADDLVVLCKTEQQAQAALETAATTLADAGLRLNPEKTRITRFAQGFRFLGYRFVGQLVVESRKENTDAPTPLPAALQEPLTPPVEPDMPAATVDYSGEEPGMLLIVNERGASLRLQDGQLSLQRVDGRNERYPFAQLAGVMLLTRAQLSTEVIKAAMRARVPIHFLTESGQWQGSTAGEPDGATLALWQVQHQHAADTAFCLRFAKAVTSARVHSLITVLSHRRAPAAVIDTLKRALGSIDTTDTVDALRGVEGQATARYFAAFNGLLPPGFDFSGRTRRPPRDPVNALLSLGYTLLHHAAHAVLLAAHLNPRLGIYHQPRGTHAALASDFIEPFRFLVERQVLSQLNRREFRPEDFLLRPDGACWLAPPARRRFIVALCQRFQQPLRAAHAEQAHGLYGHLQHQANRLKKDFEGKQPFMAPRFR
ncbi:CRISPR-associated endonuclease Cas1 [Tahibacter caeni]|uniref:CRISPR-associated endonuclease Cas1 n=1 Tax=Tahibacter caeni TaxID=1453545 RepID=UPI0021482CB3|nr:CRISPR-associated endonuclease Cas1 [Tahibacter caeni]